MHASFYQTVTEALTLMQENNVLVNDIITERLQLLANLEELTVRLDHDDLDPSVRATVVSHINNARAALAAIDDRLDHIREVYQTLPQTHPFA